MSLAIPNYTAPVSLTPFPNAYAFIVGLTIDFAAGRHLLLVNVYRSSADGNATPPPAPIDTLRLVLGAPISQTPEAAVMPTMAALVANAAALQQANPTLDPMTALRNAIYHALIVLPIFAGSTQVA